MSFNRWRLERAMRARRIVRNPQDKKPRSSFLAMVMRKSWIPVLFMVVVFAGKSAGCPAFLPVGRGGEESRPYNHIYITRKLRPVGGELH
jgi:hypothetical protein